VGDTAPSAFAPWQVRFEQGPNVLVELMTAPSRLFGAQIDTNQLEK